jgi:glutamate-1-semialdehyde aminotransferase
VKKEFLKKINELTNCKGIVLLFEEVISLEGAVVAVSIMVLERALDSTH